MTPQVLPFPWHALPALSSHDVAARARITARVNGTFDLRAAASQLEELVGLPVSLRLVVAPASTAPASGVGVVFERTGDLPHHRVLVEVEPALAVTLVTRALGQRAPRIVDASRPEAEEIAGALAAVLHSVFRRRADDRALRVVAAGPAAPLAADVARCDRSSSLLHACAVVALGAETYELTFRLLDLPAPPIVERGIARPAFGLGAAPLALSVVVAVTHLSRDDLALLEPGDAVIFDAPHLACAPDGSLRGDVTLVAPNAERGIAALLAESSKVVVRNVTHVAWDAPCPASTNEVAEDPMPEDVSNNQSPVSEERLSTALDDAPVVVRVELGAAQMTARAWASLNEGDVIALGRSVGAPALLRVGGVEVARGELVLVDGAYAVRILARTAEGIER